MSPRLPDQASPPRPESRSRGLIGASSRRQDGDRFLNGLARYTGEIDLPGTTHLAVVRSSEAHARLVSVDLELARRQPGVVAVLCGQEAAKLAGPIPHNLDPAGLGGHHVDIRCLAIDAVHYVGEPIGAVVATSEGAAKQAASMVSARYERLPIVLDAEEALEDQAPRLYPAWGTNEMIRLELGSSASSRSGSPGARTVTGRIDVGRSTSAPIEPRAYLADWNDRDGRLTWYGTTQNPHPLRSIPATALRLSETQVHVIMPSIGGSFGLKMHGHPEEILVALLSRLTGTPVRWFEDRAECMLAGGREQRHVFRARYEPDGRIVSVQDEVVVNLGAAAAGPGWGMAFVGGVTLGAGYDLDGCQVTARVAVTNKSPWAGVRGFGKDIATVVMERIVDLVARETGLDPSAVRRRNFVKSDAFPFETRSGLSLDSGNYEGLLDAVLERLDYEATRREQLAARSAGRLLGIGLAFELTPEGADIPGALVGGGDTSTVRMDPSGSVTVLTGVTSPGNGNETAIAQVVAQALGVGLSAVRLVQGDSDLCPYGYGNLSSRSAVTGSGSALLAADEIAAKLRIVAARMLDLDDPKEVVLEDGLAVWGADHSRQLPLAAVAHAVYSLAYVLADGIEPTLESTRTYRPGNIRHTPGKSGQINPFHTFGNSVHALLAEVDAETGLITIHRYVVGHDCGTQLNPQLVEGQIYGSVCAGLGAALSEEIVHSADGQLATDGFKTYLLPRPSDVPAIELISQATPSPFTPLGAKGVGESGLGGAQAAILNAVNDALTPHGAELAAIPVTPERIIAAPRSANR